LVLEGSAGGWFFADNDSFFQNTERSQDPIGSVQIHAGYNFMPGLWLAGDANYWAGGQTTVDGDDKDDRQSSTRYGVTL
jgi:predicted porin